jgi:CheY-like chemotaxis protein
MFYQGGNARKTSSAGLGIGLTLAKTLVELHGGGITVETGGENQGSLFKVRLPLARVPDVTAPSNNILTPLAGKHRILIVDDNTDAADTLCTLLKSLGEQEVYTVSSGIQALETAPRLQPDIVLLDLMMPELDGYEVARRIRKQPWGQNLLLIALSGWGHEEHRRKTQEAGFDRHVTKPADLATLHAVLRAAPVTS